jgi:hypothetical protein
MEGHPYSNGYRSRQFHAPKGQVLSDFGAVGTGTAVFRVPLPDSRVRCKVTLLYDPVPKTTNLALPQDITGVTHSIWMALEDVSFAGRQDAPVPVQNVVVNPTTGLLVTRAAPLVIPSDPGVMGFSREFVSAGDSLYGELVTGYVAAVPGRWMLYCRYQPDGLYLPPDEWQEVVGLARPQVIVAVGAGNS